MMKEYEMIISIVSHNQGQQVKLLLDDIENKCFKKDLAVVLTLNIPEKLSFTKNDYSFRLEILVNKKSRGFSVNHNKASELFTGEYFCVLNPDVRLFDDPFDKLLKCFENKSIGVVAPSVINKINNVEDNVRFLPSPNWLPMRLLTRRRDYMPSCDYVEVDWAAGMFLLFDAKLFRELKGFDEKYYLYCEDIDICSRIWLHQRKVIWKSDVFIFHEARRDSRNKVEYLLMHFISYLKLFSSSVYYRRLKQKRCG